MEPPNDSILKVLQEVEKKRGTRVFGLLQGSGHHICGQLFGAVLKARDCFNGIDTLDVVIHSPGGHPLIAYQLMKFFRRKCKHVNVIVPLQAKSAATLMCFGADRIFMGEFSELGPLDVQINDPVERGSEPFSPLDEFKSMEFLREYAVELLDYFTLLFIKRSGISIKEAIHESIPCVTGMMRPLYEKIDPLEVGGHRRALAIGEEYASRLLRLVGNQHGNSIVEKLVWKYPSHDFVVDIDEARELNLPVSALPPDQDNLLTDAIMEIEEDEVCFYGFAHTKPQTPDGATKPPKAVNGARKLRKANGAPAELHQ
ncbi:MAG: SDH family Clp fold serine proteinase [Acidobacteriota bacterium]